MPAHPQRTSSVAAAPVFIAFSSIAFLLVIDVHPGRPGGAGGIPAGMNSARTRSHRARLPEDAVLSRRLPRRASLFALFAASVTFRAPARPAAHPQARR